MYSKNVIAIAIALVILAPFNATAWPWGDASKYRSECRQACIEDSFGKAKAAEISQRCSNKCDGLQLSPRDQWYWHEKCLSDKAQYDAYEAIRPKCESELKDLEKLKETKFSNCMKDKYASEYLCKSSSNSTDDYYKVVSDECRRKHTPFVLMMEMENKKPLCDKPSSPKPK